MSKLIRFGVSIEDHLLEQFDRLIRERNYSTRSEAIRDLIRDEIIHARWQDGETESLGTITLIYDHHIGDLTHILTTVQHEFNSNIISTMHVHLDHHNCLEVLAVTGKTKTIRHLADKLISIKGVKHGKLVTTTQGADV
ncbi:MAG: nickel-responsive transcriptional regulator NikR [Calditrichaeota bacterium]|nr:nickel-responsive transcriptional regulator NikR [Calditrichota bacterium]